MMVLLTSLALALPPRVAVIVSGNQGLPGETPLKFADSDGDRVATTLMELGGFAPDAVVRVPKASRSRVEAGLSEAVLVASRLSNRDEPPELLVYFAGHAGPDGLHLAGDTFPLAELKAAARLIPAARRVFVIDSCHSGQMMRSMGATLDQLSDAPGEFAPPADEAWITSTGPEHDAFEADQRKGALFSHFLVSGLRGSADANRDRRITLHEVYDFAHARTADAAAKTGRVQDPRWAGKHGDWAVSNLHNATGGIVTAGPVPYDLLVIDEKTARVAAEIPAGTGFRVALPRGRYQLVSLEGDASRVASLNIRDGFQTLVPETRLERSPGVRARGGLLVRNPWTVAGGWGMVTGATGARKVAHGPWAALRRELGRGHRAGLRAAFTHLPTRGTWAEGTHTSALLEAVWTLDVVPSPVVFGPQLTVGGGVVAQRLRRVPHADLGAWYGDATGEVTQQVPLAVASVGLAGEVPVGPLALYGSAGVRIAGQLAEAPSWQPGLVGAVGVAWRQ